MLPRARHLLTPREEKKKKRNVVTLGFLSLQNEDRTLPKFDCLIKVSGG